MTPGRTAAPSARVRAPSPGAAGPLPAARSVRVAVFSDSLPERNGAGSYYTDLVALLQDQLEDIQLFQPTERRRLRRLQLPLPGDSTQKLITPNVFRLWRQARRLRPDVIVGVTPGPFSLVGMAYARRHGCAFLTGFHTHFEELVRLYGETLFYRVCHAYLTRVNRLLCSRSQAVIVNSERLTPTVQALGARQVEVMGTPLARPFLDTPRTQPPARLERVLVAGRLAPEKNLEAVVEAARQRRRTTFVLAGDGPLRKQLERAAAELPNLELTGWLDRRELCAEMDRASLLVLPSHFETFGTVALEALARERHVLVSSHAGICDWPRLREALFVLGEDEPLAAALERLSRSPEAEWRSRGAAGRRTAVAASQATARQWTELFCRHAECTP